MNAKKISTLILCGAGMAMLAACATAKSVDRAAAITLLGDMNTAVTASTYKAPTQYKAVQTTKTSAGTDTTETNSGKYVSDAEVYFSSVVKGTTAYSSASSIYKETGDLTIVAQIKDGNLSISLNGAVSGTTLKLYTVAKTSDVLATAAVAALQANVSVQSAIIVSSPAHMKQYISAFATGTGSSAVSAGATIGATTYMKEESYTSKGSGNLDAKITPHYTKGTYQYDESMEYVYDSNRIVTVANNMKGVTTNYTWDSSAVTAYSTTGLTEASTAQALVLYAAVATACAAAL